MRDGAADQAERRVPRPGGGAAGRWVRRAVAVVVVAAVTVAVSVAVAGLHTAAHGDARSSAPGRVQVLRLAAPVSGRPRSVWVYRPSVADTASLPVLYMLHGVPGDPSEVFTNADMATSMDAFLRTGGSPFVLAAVDGTSELHNDTEWADSADGSDQVETFVTKVAVPAVEGNHPRDVAHRAIGGFSMGGYGAMNLALRHRDLFGQVVSVAGYFHVDDPARMFAGRPDVIAANSPDQHISAARGLRILLVDGAQDDEPVVRGETQRFAALLAAAEVPATVLVIPGHHDWQLVRDSEAVLERFVEAGWSSGAAS